MCLSTVSWCSPRPNSRAGVGWKVFKVCGGRLFGDCRGGRARPVGHWLRSRDNGSENYPLGWHVFLRWADARAWVDKRLGEVVRRVAYRGLAATGYQGTRPTVVARWMRILPRRPQKEGR